MKVSVEDIEKVIKGMELIDEKAKKYDLLLKLSNNTTELHCSFCGKKQSEIKKLIAGPGVFICDECLKLCNEIMHEGEQIQQEVSQ